MATISISVYFFPVLIFFHFKVLALEHSSSFSFKSFGKDPKFESNIAFYGDAHVTNDGSVIQLTNSVKWSAGRVMYKKPIKLVEGKVRNFASFSTYFCFSMSHDKGDGLAFVMVPSTFDGSGNSSFGITFGLEESKRGVVGISSNENHVGIDVGSLVSGKVRNLSSLSLVLNNVQKLHSWIDYEATSKRLEIRLSQSRTRPNDPLLSHSIDLSKLWNYEEVFMGLSSSNGNSSQTSFIHLWSFKLRQVPNWMHSQPLDPEAISNNPKPLTTAHKSSDCFRKVLAMFILGCACGVFTASCLLYLRTTLGGQCPVAPEECSVHTVVSEYKKVELAVEKSC
ncbi:heme-binding-like protein [Hibiscus syriacus]|uniref:Heme-binding-like protein n=1 Tax=Hibiscus syriacus TaxID=106335 RepID=A0A6A2ZCM6_HIBSY|nr:L-type lectin-domain containing receptor kinase VIII.2-like [Hibiscus syriacus]KAE8689744.1 heme-binding-like protein [Hibiscus syriacus]